GPVVAIRGYLLTALEGDLRAIALAVIAGAALVYVAPTLLPLALFVPPLALCLLRFPGRVILAVLLLGAAGPTFLGHRHMAHRLPVAADGTTVWLHGHIAGLPQPQRYRTRFEFTTATTPRRLRLSWYNDPPALAPGDCYDLKVKLSAPHGSA